MTDHVEQIKDRLDVVDVIAGYIKVQKAGINFKARCPFHNEKTPSFYISPERQVWHCFGCAKGGDMFTFVQEMEGVEFPEALRVLAQKAGIQLKQFDPQISNAKTRLLEICELSAKFFEKQLAGSSAGGRAAKYLADRGMTDITIKEFRLGFAPNDWQALGRFLADCGYTTKEIVDAGMVIQRDGHTYDRFRSRIMFPIMDVNGQVVGFTGRIFEVALPPGGMAKKPEIEPAKYINTPQTLIYDKSRVLYGLAKSKTAIRQANRCLLVEGNMDAIMSFQAGASHVVATSGTALTPEQIKMLKRYTSIFDLCFDTDQAGAAATRRGIGLALSQDCSVNVVQIDDPACKDPADYVQKHGEKWLQTATTAKPVIEFYFDKARHAYDPHSAESKKSVINLVGPLINHVASQVERAHWVSQLSAFLRVPESAVSADLAVVKDDLAVYDRGAPAEPVTVATAAPQDLPMEMLSEALLSLFLKDPALFVDKLAAAKFELLDPQVSAVLVSALEYLKTSAGPLNIDAVISSAGSDYARQLEFAYLRSQELWSGFGNEALVAQFDMLLRKIQQKSISARLASITADVRQAEALKDTGRLNQLTTEFISLAGELAQIQKV